MEQETLYNVLYNIFTEQYGEILESHAMWQCIIALGIKPFKDGNHNDYKSYEEACESAIKYCLENLI